MRLIPSARFSRMLDRPHARAYVFAAALLVLIAATWLITFKLVAQAREADIAAASRETANLANAIEEHVTRTFLTADTVLRNLKSRVESGPAPSQTVVDEMLRTQQPVLTAVGAADATGMLALIAPAAGKLSIADRPHFRAHVERDSGEMFIGPPQTGRASGKRSINVSRRLNNADGSFAGIVAAGIDIDYFDRFYREVDLGQDSVISLIGRDGIVRLRRSDEGFSAGQLLQRSPALQRVAAGEPKGTLLLSTPLDSKQRIASFRALDHLPLVVIVAKSEAAALSGFYLMRRNYFAAASLLTAMLLLAGVLAALALRAYRAAAANRLQESEKRYRLALDTSRLAMWEWDVAADRVSVSEMWPKMLGHPERALSMSTAQLRDSMHPDDADRARQCAIAVLKGHAPRLDIEYRLATQAGGWLWCHASGEVLQRDAAGRALRLVGTQSDISARKSSEDALRLSEERFRSAFDQASVGITVVSPENRFLQVNDKYCDLTGYSRAELMTMGIEDVNRPHDMEIALDQQRQLLARDLEVAYCEKQVVRKDGSLVWISVATSLVRGNDGSPLHFISIVQDLSETKNALAALHESEEQFRQFADNIPLTLWMIDPVGGRTIYISPAGRRLVGADTDRHPRKLVGAVHPDDRRRIHQARKRAGEGHYDEIFRIQRTDGALRWVHDRAFPVHDEQGNLLRIVGITEDITDQRLTEERIAHASLHDALTGLPNRIQLHQRLTEAVAGADRQNVAVLLIDADHFKKINDTLGHASGDELLKQLTERLLQIVSPDDLVARMGGDEFALLLRHAPTPAHAERVAAAIVEAMRRPCHVGTEEAHVGVSIGIALAGRDGTDADTLIRNADAAMYGAKNAGRNAYRFYNAEMTRRAVEMLKLENSLRRALERGEFSLHYQPKARMDGEQIVGFEALLRWKHPVRGMVAPAEFIPVLEETGLIVPVGEWVIREVCAQLRTWEKYGMGNLPVALNVSARQFSEAGFATRVKRILDEEMIDPRMIEMEITESVLMAGADVAIGTLQVLKLLGISISVDDFGTGYSSLSYLKRFPLDALKIDRSFVRDIPEDLDDAAITRTIISMAHGLRLKVIAEGVERPEQMQFLAQHNCDFVQGYLVAKPQPAQEWTDKYGRDPLAISQRMYLRLARGPRGE